MEKEYVITPNGFITSDELRHWGIKGQKWGVRRYQNADGSLTTAGKKRYAKLESEMKQLKPKKSTKERKAEVEKEARKKLVSEMTDDELRERTNRMRMERDYYDAARNLAVVNPVKVSAGKKFATSLLNDVIAPAAKVAGKEYAEKFMKDKLGLNKKEISRIERLEAQAKELKAEKEIKEYEAAIKNLKKKGPNVDKTIEKFGNMTSEEYDTLVRAAAVQYYREAVKGKGAKPDKGNGKNKKDDD